MGWNYHLEEEGKKLRQLVDGEETYENSATCLDQLRVCCKKVMNILEGRDKELYYFDFEELYELMDGEPEILRTNPDEILDWEFNDATELVNDRLEQFYNLCDGVRVWVGLGF